MTRRIDLAFIIALCWMAFPLVACHDAQVKQQKAIEVPSPQDDGQTDPEPKPTLKMQPTPNI